MTWQALPWQSSLQAAFTTIWGSGVSPIPSLDLNFTLGSLDPRITYTGASLATLTDATGKIAYKPHNLLTYSEDFTNAAWSKAQTTVTANATSDPNGQLTADKLVEQAVLSTHNLTQAGTTTVGTTYTFSIRAKAAERRYIVIGQDSGGTGYFEVDLQSGSFTASTVGTYLSRSITAEANGFYKITITYVAANTGATGFLFIGNASGISIVYTGDGTSGVYVWGAQLNVGPLQPYCPTTSAAYYGPRFTYDPVTHAALGLLIEEQRTNLLTYSEKFTDSSWSGRARTVANTGMSPDGTTNASTLSSDGTSSDTGKIVGVAATSNAAYTLTCYVEYTNNQWVLLQLSDVGTAHRARVWFDIQNGTKGGSAVTGSGVVVDYTIQRAGNGWYRISLTATNPITTLYAYFPIIVAGNNSTAAAANGQSVRLWGAQLEAGAFATSYIPTTSASVTRAADSAKMTGSNFSSWFNAVQGTVIVEGASAASSGYALLAGISAAADYSGNNAIELFLGGGTSYDRLNISVSSVDLCNITSATSMSAGSMKRIAGGWTTSGQAICQNGGAVATHGSIAGLPASLAQMYIGSRNTALSNNGPIKRLRYYNTALTNAQLQALTA